MVWKQVGMSVMDVQRTTIFLSSVKAKEVWSLDDAYQQQV